MRAKLPIRLLMAETKKAGNNLHPKHFHTKLFDLQLISKYKRELWSKRRFPTNRREYIKRTVDIRSTAQGNTAPTDSFQLRNPSLDDASGIWQLVVDSQILDRNSCYMYMLLCRDFAETCVVAESDEGLAGVITAYRPPLRQNVIFVWQVAVAEHARRRGLAKQMLHHLVSLPTCKDTTFVETTVTPSNMPSQQMFKSFAADLHVPFEVVDGFSASEFATGDHEDEQLWRIGPLE